MNMHTGDWHGNRLDIYHRGYQKGYDSVKGYGSQGANGPGQYQGEDRRAYQAGYQNGINAARNNRNMNISTDDWHGDRVNIYQQAYREGYNSVRATDPATNMQRTRRATIPTCIRVISSVHIRLAIRTALTMRSAGKP